MKGGKHHIMDQQKRDKLNRKKRNKDFRKDGYGNKKLEGPDRPST